VVQDRSRLGGNSSSEVKMRVVGANQHTARPGWREGGLIEELRLADAVNNHQRCWELWDLLLYDKVVSEPAPSRNHRVLGCGQKRAHSRSGRALRQERAPSGVLVSRCRPTLLQVNFRMATTLGKAVAQKFLDWASKDGSQ